MCACIARSAASRCRRRTARRIARCWARIASASTRGEIVATSDGWRTSRIQPVSACRRSLPDASARIWWKRLSAMLNGSVPGWWPGGVLDRLLEAGDDLVVGVDRRAAGDRDLERQPGVEQLAHRDRLGRQHQRDRLGEVAAHALAGRARDEDAARAPAADADQVRGGQQPQRLAHRRAADAELVGQLLLGPDPLARWSCCCSSQTRICAAICSLAPSALKDQLAAGPCAYRRHERR